MITAEELIGSIYIDDGDSNITKLATVIELFEGGAPKLKFDGEDIPSEKEYVGLGSYKASVGDRVLLLGASGTWVILGKISLSDGYSGFNNMVVDGSFQHIGGPDAKTGVAFFGKPPMRQKTTTMLASNATLSDVITVVNNHKTLLKEFGFYA